MFKGNISFYKKKEIIATHELWMKGKFMLRTKEKFILWTFWIKEKVILGFLRVKGDLSQHRKLVERSSFLSIYENCMIFKEPMKMIFQFLRNDKIIFPFSRNYMLTDYWKVLVLDFLKIKTSVFLEPRSWWEDDIYWLMKKALVLNF